MMINVFAIALAFTLTISFINEGHSRLAAPSSLVHGEIEQLQTAESIHLEELTENTESLKQALDRCPSGKTEIEGLNCGRGGGACPEGSECLIDPGDRFAVCCQNSTSLEETTLMETSAAARLAPPSTANEEVKELMMEIEEEITEVMTQQEHDNRCTDGAVEIEGVFCGMGPHHEDCPAGSECLIDPADRFAVCCVSNSTDI